MQTVGVLAAIVGFSIVTAFAVHYSDKTSSDHTMMMSETAHKQDMQRAETAAAMKQEATDKMAEHDAMVHDTSTNVEAMTP